MSLFNEPFNLDDKRCQELLELVYAGYDSTDQIKLFVGGIGIPAAHINWNGALVDVWPRILAVAARRAKLRKLVQGLLADDNYAVVRPQLKELYVAAEKDRREEAKRKVASVDHARVTMVGPRPFINRSRFRDNVNSLFGPGGDRLMIIDGPPKSGRSYSWVLISYVTRMTGGLQTSLIDMSQFRGDRAKPDDVAKMIAADLNWPPPKRDRTAQDPTRGRVLLGWLKTCLRGRQGICLVFDGLDGDNLSEEAVSFIGDIAVAAGNDELGDSRVVLLAFGRALQNPNVDPFVLREPPLGDIPLAEFTRYLRSVAAEGGQHLSEGQAMQFAERLFGSPQPDPVPVSQLAARADAMSRIVGGLRRGTNG